MQEEQKPNERQKDSSKEQQDSLERAISRAGKEISVQEAILRTKLFREGYMDKIADKEVIKANYFSKDAILKVLNQPGCHGLRIYHSVNPNGTDPITGVLGPVRELILIGTGKDGNDFLSTSDYPGGGKPGKGCNILGAIISLPASQQLAKDAKLVANPAPCPTMCGSKPNPIKG